jgi:hypothetical protein
VHLGFEVGSGDPVEIPLRHMVVTGQTQEAGKTTTLEALIARAGVRAVAFVTKRGEGSFSDAHTIAPYFSEETTDAGYIEWRYVASILEASLGEKLKFERTWIMRATKGATTLADVQRNVRAALENPKTNKGLSGDIYFALNEYLQAVVPQIAAVRWARKVELVPGINAMDLGALGIELQHLVIRSTIDWVLHHAEDTVVVVPEAWKFIPQGRGTPVKRAAEAFIRQAAAMRNYLWLDSQDIAGIEKLILKSVPVWILGVQREVNEVKRTLDQMPVAMPKLTPRQVATLKLGEFYACYGEHAIKTYVQPIWLDAAEAAAIARGAQPARGPRRHPTPNVAEDTVTEQEATALRTENADLRQRIGDLEEQIAQLAGRTVGTSGAKMPAAEDARASGRDFVEPPSPAPPSSLGAAERLVGTVTDEVLYQAFKARLIAEAPAVLQVLGDKPELRVAVERRTIEANGDTLIGRLAILISKGFFDEATKAYAAFVELNRRGIGSAKPNVYKACDQLAKLGFLTKEADGYKTVAGMKINIVEAA